MLVQKLVLVSDDAAAIRCVLPLRYDEDVEELGADHPGVSGRTLTLVLDLDTGRVRDWPEGRESEIHLKVVDEGRYELLDREGYMLAVVEDYVPRCVPGEYGDYFVARIGSDGTVAGWRPTPREIEQSFGLQGER